ncbi:CBS domain-containing protein [Streptomyces sp. NPDC049597]|uniref:CBS domain-containing protein n=1 Tax=Streptomyces sp. NPDC049597 TaxID=3155276 RepID=UPI00342C8C03
MPRSPHTVSDVMTRTPIAVGRRASYREIVELLARWKVSALPVLEGDGRVVGVVSEADLLPKEVYRDAEPPLQDSLKASGLYADQLMSSPAITVHADATIAEAARIMARRGVKRLPVVNSAGLLEGVVSRGDLLKVFLRPDEDIAAEIRDGVLGAMPAASELQVVVADGVVTVGGLLTDRRLVPLLMRAAQAVEGVVDVRLDLQAHAIAGSENAP